MAALARKEVPLFKRFNSLRDHSQPQTLGQDDDHFCNGGIVGVGKNVSDEALVDLQLIQRQSLEVGERRIAGAKIVEGEAYSHCFQSRHLGDDVFHVMHQHTLGQLQLQTLWIGSVVIKNRLDLINKVRQLQLTGAEIHGDSEMSRLRSCSPQGQLGAGSLQYPVA